MKYIHLRRRDREDGHVLPTGGITVAYEEIPGSPAVHYAFAKCSTRDAFNKKMGRAIASGRLKAGRIGGLFTALKKEDERPIDAVARAIRENRTSERARRLMW